MKALNFHYISIEGGQNHNTTYYVALNDDNKYIMLLHKVW